MVESWTVNVPFASSERIRDIVSREQTLDNINQKVATETTLDKVLKASEFTETRTISTDNVGLFKTTDFTEIRNVRELQNETGVNSGQVTDDTTGSSLPSGAVPDGSKVSVKALPSNNGNILVDGNFTLEPKASVSLQVDDTSKISFTANNSGEGVAYIVEA